MDTQNNAPNRWRHLFIAVLIELDSEKFSARLTAVDDAIFYRLLDLEGAAGSGDERLALEDALQDLRLLRDNRFQFDS